MQRKLSVDVNETIPAVGSDPELRRSLVARVEAVEAEHGLLRCRPGTEESEDKTQVAEPGASIDTPASVWIEVCVALLTLAVLGWLCFIGLRAIVHRLHTIIGADSSCGK